MVCDIHQYGIGRLALPALPTAVAAQGYAESAGCLWLGLASSLPSFLQAWSEKCPWLTIHIDQIVHVV